MTDRNAATCSRSCAGSTRSSLVSADSAADSTPPPAAGRGAAQSDRDRDRLVVVEHERRQVPAGAEGVAAVGPGRPGDRVAEAAEPGHVAPHGALGHLEPFGELGGGPRGPGREQHEQPQQAGRRVHIP